MMFSFPHSLGQGLSQNAADVNRLVCLHANNLLTCWAGAGGCGMACTRRRARTRARIDAQHAPPPPPPPLLRHFALAASASPQLPNQAPPPTIYTTATRSRPSASRRRAGASRPRSSTFTRAACRAPCRPSTCARSSSSSSATRVRCTSFEFGCGEGEAESQAAEGAWCNRKAQSCRCARPPQ